MEVKPATLATVNGSAWLPFAWHWPWQEQPHQAFHEHSTHEGNPELMQG